MEAMSPEEHAAMEALNEVCACIGLVIGNGPTRDADLHEAVLHIHALQQMVMSNAAARAYPNDYRLLGETLR